MPLNLLHPSLAFFVWMFHLWFAPQMLQAIVNGQQPAGGAITLVNQTPASHCVSSGACSITSTTAGNMLIATLGSGPAGTAPHITAISGCGTWTNYGASNTNRDAEIWAAPNISGSCTSVSTTWSGSTTGAGINISEWSGMRTTIATDGSPSTNSGTPPVVTLTTTNATDLIVTIVRGSATPTINGGFTALNIASVGNAIGEGYRITSSTGTYAPAWSGSSTGDAIETAFQQ